MIISLSTCISRINACESKSRFYDEKDAYFNIINDFDIARKSRVFSSVYYKAYELNLSEEDIKEFIVNANGSRIIYNQVLDDALLYMDDKYIIYLLKIDSLKEALFFPLIDLSKRNEEAFNRLLNEFKDNSIVFSDSFYLKLITPPYSQIYIFNLFDIVYSLPSLIPLKELLIHCKTKLNEQQLFSCLEKIKDTDDKLYLETLEYVFKNSKDFKIFYSCYSKMGFEYIRNNRYEIEKIFINNGYEIEYKLLNNQKVTFNQIKKMKALHQFLLINKIVKLFNLEYIKFLIDSFSLYLTKRSSNLFDLSVYLYILKSISYSDYYNLINTDLYIHNFKNNPSARANYLQFLKEENLLEEENIYEFD